MLKIKSESTSFPALLDTASSDTTTYVRSNVIAEDRKDQTGKSLTMYVYDEVQYSKEEYRDYEISKQTADISYVAMMMGVDLYV